MPKRPPPSKLTPKRAATRGAALGASAVLDDSAGKGIVVTHVAPAALTPAPYNPRTIDEASFARLQRGIAEFGLVDPIVARRTDGLVVGGHQRLKAATALGLATVPVVYLDDLSDDRAAALNVLLNNPSAQGAWDMGALSGLLSELDAHGFDATLTGFDDDALAGLLAWEATNETCVRDEDAGVDLAPPAAPRSKPGEIYQLGRHRLLCGDSTDAANRARVLEGASPGLLVFDPPFEAADVIARSRLRDVAAPDVLVFGDCMYATARAVDLAPPWRFQFVWDGVTRWIVPGKPLLAHKTCDWFSVTGAYDHDRVKDPREIETKPQKGKNARGAYELAPDPRGKSLASVFRSPITDESHGVSHAKPVLWLSMLFGNCSQGPILDLFGGSGAALIAAEAIGRPWHGIELDPGHCDVIRRRFADYAAMPACAP